jgi:hypothetical protein
LAGGVGRPGGVGTGGGFSGRTGCGGQIRFAAKRNREADRRVGSPRARGWVGRTDGGAAIVCLSGRTGCGGGICAAVAGAGAGGGVDAPGEFLSWVAWRAAAMMGEACLVGAEGKGILPRMSADKDFGAAG